MPVSKFRLPPRRQFSSLQKALACVPLYGIGVPLVRLLEMNGRWPHLMSKAGVKVGDFGDYAATPRDVFVCSYFKSGTNWMLQIAIQAVHRGHAEFENIHEAVPWPDCPSILKDRVIPLEGTSPAELSPTGLRVIKTHRPRAEVPFDPGARYIVVERDPKDVCVSGYHFFKSLAWGPLAPSIDSWVDYFVSPHFHLGAWATHVDSFWRIRNEPNVLFLTFEQMKRDAGAAIRQVVDLLGVRLSDDELEVVEHKSSFAHMKLNDAQFSPGQAVPWSSSGAYMIRSGKHGASGELLTPQMRRRIDEHCRSELQRLGSDFPYADLYMSDTSDC